MEHLLEFLLLAALSDWTDLIDEDTIDRDGHFLIWEWIVPRVVESYRNRLAIMGGLRWANIDSIESNSI